MRPRRRQNMPRTPYLIFAGIAALFLLLTVICFYLWPTDDSMDDFVQRFPKHLETNEIAFVSQDINSTERKSSCTFHTCVNVYHCGYNDETKISVYIYPIKEYVDDSRTPLTSQMSREFAEILQAIAESPFYTKDPETACMYVPSIDLLNQNRILAKETGKVLAALTWYVSDQIHVCVCVREIECVHVHAYFNVCECLRESTTLKGLLLCKHFLIIRQYSIQDSNSSKLNE